MTEPAKPVCPHCGNDGSKSGLYVTVDARWTPDADGWTLQARDDDGGRELDCMECDQRSPDPAFPYDSIVARSATVAWIVTAESFETPGRVVRVALSESGADATAADLCNAVLDEWPNGSPPAPATATTWKDVATRIMREGGGAYVDVLAIRADA